MNDGGQRGGGPLLGLGDWVGLNPSSGLWKQAGLDYLSHAKEKGTARLFEGWFRHACLFGVKVWSLLFPRFPPELFRFPPCSCIPCHF